jgi:hypothetical protein
MALGLPRNLFTHPPYVLLFNRVPVKLHSVQVKGDVGQRAKLPG